MRFRERLLISSSVKKKTKGGSARRMTVHKRGFKMLLDLKCLILSFHAEEEFFSLKTDLQVNIFLLHLNMFSIYH